MTFIQNKKIQNYVHNIDTSFTKEAISTSVEVYPGTEVTYTPVPGSSNVIYECNLQVSWDPDGMKSYICTRLQYSTNNGSTWGDFSGSKMFEGASGAVADNDWFSFCWIFLLPTWSGERLIRLAGRSYNSASEYTIGRSYNAAGSEGSGSCPHVSIYSIM